jgi:arginyl-tRNA synthetase
MKNKLQKRLKGIILELKKEGDWSNFDLPKIEVDNTKEENFGDYTSNIAMVLASKIKKIL